LAEYRNEKINGELYEGFKMFHLPSFFFFLFGPFDGVALVVDSGRQGGQNTTNQLTQSL
jgi:hypothetical protein